MEVVHMGMLNTPEIIMILVLALVLFGAKKLPELAKGLGHGIKEFRKASREISEELNSAVHEEPPPPPRRLGSESIPATPEGVQPHGVYGSTEESVPEPAKTEAEEPPVSKA
jgi:sec-independent protein translocase protein TatA